MEKELSFNDIFEYKSVSFKILGVEYDIMKKEDVEKIPCISATANIFGKNYTIDYILRENARHIQKRNENLYLAEVCIKKAEEIELCTHKNQLQSENTEKEVVNVPQTLNSNKTINKKLRKEYATTLLLWGHERAFEYQENRQYPTYYQYECGLSNPNALFKELMDEGYFQASAYCEILDTYTVKNLSIIADSLGISKSGRKEDLIKRILVSSTPADLRNHFGDTPFYSLSDKGKAYLQSHKDYIIFHRYGARMNVNLEKYSITKNELKTSDCETVLIYLMNQRIQKNRFDELSHTYLKELYDYTNQPDKAMFEFIAVLYFNINHLWDFQLYINSLQYSSHDFEKQRMIDSLYPSNCLCIEHAIYFSKNVRHFKTSFVDFIYQRYQLEHLIIEKESFLEILKEMETSAFFDLEKWNDIIYEKYASTIKGL
ncbi:MAG: hypothetical protein PHV18_15490 [Lachnospiraceae bacterium]|nr:hypothetical protein [Lachnospiraceae bacterium]